jgi:membrane protein implicated in regulation of membrane protease activity
MAETTVWWVLAGATIAIELVTGTFYLLMLAIGLTAAAISAHLGAGVTTQVVVAALVGCSAVVLWRSYKLKVPAAAPAGANHDVNLDIGETVHVDVWDAEGMCSVKYRGANWSASLVATASPSPGAHKIVEVVGSRLILEKL